MKPNSNLQVTRPACLLIALAWALFPLAARADDAATAPAPETANAPAAAPASEAAKAPSPVPTPALTNMPETAPTMATTNTPAVMATEATNTPPPVTAPAITNLPPAAPAVAATNKPAAVIAPVPAAAPAAAAAPATTTPATPAPAKPAPPATTFKETPARSYQPFNIGAEGGTTGLGGTAGWRFANHFGLVGGMDYLNYSMNRTVSDIPYSAEARWQSEYAGLNLYPSRDSSFHLSLGAYFNQNRFTGSAVSDGSLTIDGAPVADGESVKLEYKQQPVDPYVAIGGNIYFDKARHFSLGLELGAFYLGNPIVNVSTTDPGVPQSALDSYKKQVEDDIKKVPVWPILKISLNYSF